MKKHYSKNAGAIIIALITIFFACKKNSEPNPGDGTGTVQGNITDLNNSPISNATVTSGTATATTDVSGNFTLTNVAFDSDTVVVIVTKNGFFEGAKRFVSGNHTVNNASIQLVTKTVSATIVASSGGTVAIQGGGSVNFVPGFINASNGNAYNGNVSVSTYHLGPSDPKFNTYASGELKAAGTNNPQGSLQSFGVVLVEMNDASGNKLQLAPGIKATITLPTALQGKAPSAVPLWYFDVAKGKWKQDGIAEKQTGNYIGTVSHFSSWNPGNIVDTSQYIRLTLNGTNYSWSPSDSDGVNASYMQFDAITGITGGHADYNYFKGQIGNNNSTSAGDYPFILKLMINRIFYSSDKNDSRNKANVTEYGPVGGYIKGSASGWIGSSAYNCTYKLIRIQ